MGDGPPGDTVMREKIPKTLMAELCAKVDTIGSYSAHADQHDLLNFVKRMRKPPREIRLVHGDSDAKRVLKAKIEEWAAGAGHELKVNLAGTTA